LGFDPERHAAGLHSLANALHFVRKPCGRRGRYNVDKVIAERGDAKLTNLLATLADYPNAPSVRVNDQASAVYGGL
jgi:hypothetical protein